MLKPITTNPKTRVEEEGRSRKLNEGNMIKASCTWGEAEDVLLAFDGTPFMLYENPKWKDRGVHGFVEKGSASLTAAEAEVLGHQLLAAAAQARQLDKSAEDYFAQHKTEGG